MEISIEKNKRKTSEKAASKASKILSQAIQSKGSATFVAATGASQFDFLDFLSEANSVDWSKTTMFHLDEYIGLPETHPASFRKYLKERLVQKVKPDTVHFINGNVDNPKKECQRLNSLIDQINVDVAFVGIGENGHIAFNDPPADFEVEDPYIVVDLDNKCRRQQVNEGWFEDIESVPKQAISMSVKQIMRSNSIVCTIPGERKAKAVKRCLQGEITPECPASILQNHDRAFIYLDKHSSSLME